MTIPVVMLLIVIFMYLFDLYKESKEWNDGRCTDCRCAWECINPGKYPEEYKCSNGCDCTVTIRHFYLF